MRLWPQRRLVGTVMLSALIVCAGCSDDEGFFGAFVTPTEVAVSPSDFLGDVSCSTNAGAMRSYVLTLTDYEDASDTSGFVVGSSLPIPCSMVAGFRDSIIVGHLYTAEIDAYDIAPELLLPFGGASSGARQLHSVETGTRLSPRWTTRCGAGADTGVAAATNQRRFVRPCEPLVDAAPSPTAVAVTPSAVLGEDACAVADSFSATEDAGHLPAVTDLACDADPLVFDAVAGESYQLYATASNSDGEPIGAECSATAAEGQTVVVQCRPLTTQGNARLSLASLMAADAPVCPAAMFFDVALAGDTLNSLPLPCSGVTNIGPLSAGIYPFDVFVYDAMGMIYGAGAECAVDVRPGRTRDAFCVPLP